MQVLIYGAGVIGSVFAGHLHQAGNDVTILARGARFAALRKHGLILQDDSSGELTYHHIPVADVLEPTETFELTIVAVRKDQVGEVLPALGNRNLGNILFMVNNAGGYREWAEVVGPDRVLVGSPGAGGSVQDGIVRYALLPSWLQPTTIGELDGHITLRLKSVGSALKHAGFPVAVCRNMDAWQKTHIAIVSPLANAIYMAGGTGALLAQKRNTTRLLFQAIREGFAVLSVLKVPITPARLRMIDWMPESLLISALCKWARSQQFEIVAVRHANAATSEMRTLADEFQYMISLSGLQTPAIAQLRAFIPTATQLQYAATA